MYTYMMYIYMKWSESGYYDATPMYMVSYTVTQMIRASKHKIYNRMDRWMMIKHGCIHNVGLASLPLYNMFAIVWFHYTQRELIKLFFLSVKQWKIFLKNTC